MILLLYIFIFFHRYLIVVINKNIKNYFSICPLNDSSVYFYYSDFYRYNKINQFDYRNLLSTNPVRFRQWYSWFFSRLIKREILFKNSFIPNLLIFNIAIIIYSLFLYSINYSFKEIVIVLLILIILPENIILRIWNINFFSFSPRLLVILFNSIYWFIFLKFQSENIFLYYSILIVFGIINLYLSNFSRQSFFLTNLFFSFFSINCFLILVISIFFFLIISPSRNYLLIKNQIIIFSWQFRRFNKKNLINRTTVKQNIYSPILLIFLISLCEDTDVKFFLIVILLIYSITSLSYFSFIGENWRYISTNYIFLAPIIIFDKLIYYTKYVDYFILLLPVVVLSLTYFLNLSQKRFDREVDVVKDIEKIIKDKKYLKKANWYAAPYLISMYPMNFSYGKATLMFNKGEFDRSEFPATSYPYIPLNKDLIIKYKLTHVLILKNKLEEINRKKIISSNIKLNLIEQNKSIQLFEISNV